MPGTRCALLVRLCSFATLDSKGFPSRYKKNGVCPPALIFLKRRLTNTPRHLRLADGQLSSLYQPSPCFSSFDATSAMLCGPAPPACSSTPFLSFMHYQSVSLVVNVMCIQTFRGHLNALHIFDQTYLYRFEAKLELYDANARFFVSLPSFSPCHQVTPPPSLRQALTTFPPSLSFSSVCPAYVNLCCFPPPSLVRNTRLFCLAGV